MANTLTNLTDTIISNAAIEAFTAAMTPLTAFSLNVSTDAAKRGDKVKVLNVAAAAAAQDFNKANGYVMQDSTAEGLDVPLNKHKYVSWFVNDTDLSQNPQLNIEIFGRQKGFALAKAVIQDIWSLVTLANYGAAGFTGAASTFDADDVADLEQACDEADWPEAGRALVLKPAYKTALVKDDAVQGDAGIENSDVKSLSRIQRIHDFGLYKSNLVPANAQNLVGFAAVADAMFVAMRYLAPQKGNKYYQAAPVTDPNGSGFTIGLRDWYDEDKGERKKVLECVYGYLKGNGAGLKRVVSA